MATPCPTQVVFPVNRLACFLIGLAFFLWFGYIPAPKGWNAGRCMANSDWLYHLSGMKDSGRSNTAFTEWYCQLVPSYQPAEVFVKDPGAGRVLTSEYGPAWRDQIGVSWNKCLPDVDTLGRRLSDDCGGCCGPQAHALIDHSIQMLASCHCREIERVNVLDLIMDEFLMIRISGECVEQEGESWGSGVTMRWSEGLQKFSLRSRILESALPSCNNHSGTVSPQPFPSIFSVTIFLGLVNEVRGDIRFVGFVL